MICPHCRLDGTGHFCKACLHPLSDAGRKLAGHALGLSAGLIEDMIEALDATQMDTLRERQKRAVRKAREHEAKQKPFGK